MTQEKTMKLIEEEELRLYAKNLLTQTNSIIDTFHLVLNEFNGTPYKWGKSTITESDCSGTICATINAVFNKNIRVTANDLFYNIFTEPYTKGTENIHAVFFINKDKKAVHVAGYIGNGLYLNESQREPFKCGTPRTFEELKKMYPDFLVIRRSFSEVKYLWD